MHRRSFLSLCVATALVPVCAFAAGANPLADAFAALTAKQRRIALVEMQIAGLYSGSVEDAGSDAINVALQATADAVVAAGYDGQPMDVRTAAGATAFVTALAVGDLSKWLYGEGNEMDG